MASLSQVKHSTTEPLCSLRTGLTVSQFMTLLVLSHEAISDCLVLPEPSLLTGKETMQFGCGYWFGFGVYVKGPLPINNWL